MEYTLDIGNCVAEPTSHSCV